MSNALTTISNDIYGVRANFESVSVDRSINFEREAGFAIQVIGANEYALKVAMGNRQSVIDAVTNVAAIGISLNPAKKQAYLVPRKNKICLDISYMGLMDLAMETGSIKWAQAALVCSQDTFALNGLDKPPLHQFNPFSKDRGDVIGVYVVVKTADGEYLTHTMAAADVYAIRDRSESWTRGIPGKRGPWETDPGEMMKKTVVKQAYKYWPKTERLEEAIHHLDTDGGEGLPPLQQRNECPADVLKAWNDKAATAKDRKALTQVWQDGLAVIRPTKDMRAYDSFKAAVAARGTQLDAPPDDGKTIDMEPAREPGADDEFVQQMDAAGEQQ